MEKKLFTLIMKKENCGHAVLGSVCKYIDIPNPAENKKMIKTADLYLLDANFKMVFDKIFEVAKNELNLLDDVKEEKDVAQILSEIKKGTEILDTGISTFNKVYRETATADTTTDILNHSTHLSVLKIVVKDGKEKVKDSKEELKKFYMKKYGLL